MNYTKQKRNRPRLDRRNAIKNIDYEASNSPSSESSSFEDSSSSSHRLLRSLDHFSDRTSFRVEGIEGEFDLICRSLGLSGPEDFSIPVAAWEASKASSPSARLRSSRFRDNFAGVNLVEDDQLPDSFAASVAVRNDDDDDGLKLGNDCDESITGVNVVEFENRPTNVSEDDDFRNDQLHREGTEGFRPRELTPPPVVSRKPVDNTISTWDIFRDFGPPDTENLSSSNRSEKMNGIMDRHDVAEEESMNDGAIVSESCSDSSNDDENDADDNSFNLIRESVYSISPQGTFRRSINSWQKGDFLGSGSFGTVYEGFTE